MQKLFIHFAQFSNLMARGCIVKESLHNALLTFAMKKCALILKYLAFTIKFVPTSSYYFRCLMKSNYLSNIRLDVFVTFCHYVSECFKFTLSLKNFLSTVKENISSTLSYNTMINKPQNK